MSDHPNAALARDAYAAIAKGDLDALRGQLLADDVVFHIPGHGPLGGDRHGKDEVLRFVAQLNERTKGGLQLEPYAILTNDDYAAALVRVKGQREARRCRTRASTCSASPAARSPNGGATPATSTRPTTSLPDRFA